MRCTQQCQKKLCSDVRFCLIFCPNMRRFFWVGCELQTSEPGGTFKPLPPQAFASTAMHSRQSITNADKLAILMCWRRASVQGTSLHNFADANGVAPSQIRRWKKLETRLSQSRPDATTISRGRAPTFTEQEEDDLLRWIFDRRDAGIGISLNSLKQYACEMFSGLKEKSTSAKESTLRRFLKRHRLTTRVCTHSSSVGPEQERRLAGTFMASIVPRIASLDKRLIINMDETAVFFDMSRNRTIDRVGARHVNMRKTSSSTLRVTVAVAVTASGSILRPMIIFKGQPQGRIATRELPEYPPGSEYACQPHAWMDGATMQQWVKKCLQPYIASVPVEAQSPVLLLDSFRCHVMAPVLLSINSIGVQVEHVPSHCTALVQPIDVGVNRSFKSRIRDQWEHWLLEKPIGDPLDPPTRPQVASWIIRSLQELSPDVIRRSWRSHDFPYFTDTE